MKTVTTKEHYLELQNGKSVTVYAWSNHEGATISVYEKEKERVAFSGTWVELNALAAGINAAQS
jgi:hypothetical protein